MSSYSMILESLHHDQHHQQLAPLGLSLRSGSSDIVLPFSDNNSSSNSKNSRIIRQLSHFRRAREGAHGSPGKMLMSVAKGSGKGKTIAQDLEMQGLTDNHYSFRAAAIRMCSNCGTTKTPLWRSGPGGPKSLCNACGIRQRKAKHAMEVAAATTDIARGKSCKVFKEKKREKSYILPFKKRFQITNL
ncbi:hypothetical protein ZIOFF_050946 [Zingiber officinale]|uniref:GATA-type domain-containing protein n=1 Tax=Zingiber officinale TaxID=94328 RepID=A0A8J5FJQ3_ZINOF|nr:hypothetical protein ZIOFF_050946 [Zingiber officinale]